MLGPHFDMVAALCRIKHAVGALWSGALLTNATPADKTRTITEKCQSD